MDKLAEYFNNRLNQEIYKGTLPDEYSKYDELQRASQEKQARLQELREQQLAARERDKNSWATKAGLSTTELPGQLVNQAASFVSGTTRLGGQLASLPANITALVHEEGLSDEDVASFNRYKQGQATPEDLTRLNRQDTSYRRRGYEVQAPEQNKMTPLQRFEEAIAQRQLGGDIAKSFDTTSIVNQTNRDQLHADLKEGFQDSWEQVKNGSGVTETVVGLAKLIGNAGEAAISNPAASLEYIVENIPQLAVGAMGKAGMAAMTTSNVGYGADLYRQGIQAYQAQNDGELPPVEVRQQIAMDASKAVLAEQGGDMFTLGMSKAGSSLKGMLKGAKEEADVIRTGFKEAILNTAKAGGENLVTEATTEGYQTKLEGDINQKPASAEDIYVGATIGGIAGAGMASGGRALAEAAKATPEHAEKRVQEEKDKLDLLQAAATNDPSAYTDPKKSSFDPEKAMAVMLHHSKSDKATPESIAENHSKALELVSKLEDQHLVLSMQSPEGLASLKESVSTAQEDLKAATDPQHIALLNQSIEANQESIAEIEAMPANKQKANAQALAKLTAQLDSVRNQKQQLEHLLAPAEVESATELATTVPDSADAAAVEQHKLAIDKMINLSMAAPDRISEETAINLAKNANQTLTKEQQAHFNALAQAKSAERIAKSMSKVKEDVLFGNSKTNQLGLANYRSRITDAVGAGNQKVADRYLKMLESFARTHTAKAGVFAQAYEEIKKQKYGNTLQLIPSNGVWSIAPQQYSQDKLSKLGGLSIHANSKELVDSVAAEAKALRQGLKALKSSAALKFTNTTEVNSVPDGTLVTPADQGQLQSNVDSSVNSEKESTSVVEKAPVNEKAELFRTVDEAWTAKEQNVGEALSAVEADRKIAKEYAPFDKERMELRDKKDKSLEEHLRLAELSDIYDLLSIKHDPINALKDAVDSWTTELKDLQADAEVMDDPEYIQERTKAINELLAKAQEYQKRAEQSLTDAAEAATVANDKPALTALLKDAEFTEDEINEQLQYAFEGETFYDLDQGTEAESHSSGNQEGESTTGQVTEAKTTEEASTSTVETGELSLLQSFLPNMEGKTMHEVFSAVGFNPIAQFFKQAKISERYAGTRPLVAIKDFLTNWGKDFKAAYQFLPEDRLDNLTDEEEGALNDLGAHMEEWVPTIKNSFLAYKGDPRYKLADMMQYLLIDTKEGLDTEENVKSAMAYGMYSWLVRKASSPTLKTNKQINDMLGYESDNPIHPGTQEAPNELYHLHSFEHAVANELGGNALDALGLKLREDSPPDLMARLKTAMGLHMIAALESNGYVRRDELTGQQIENLIQHGVRDFDAKSRVATAENELEEVVEDFSAPLNGRTFISLKLDNKYNLIPEIKQIQKANAGTHGIVDVLFGNESVSEFASTKPMKFTQVFAKKTKQMITKLQRKAIQKTMNTPHKVNQVMQQMVVKLGEEAFLKIAGKVDLDSGFIHAVNRPAVEAQNRNLERQYDLMMDLLDKSNLGEQEFYVAQEVWKNYRAGFATADLNMQTSKIHRGMFSKPSWNVTYDPSKPEEYNRLITEMKVAVAMNLGLVKTDQQTNVFSIEKFDERLSSDPQLRKALDAIRADHKDHNKVWTADEVDAVTEVASKEGVLALQALTVYAAYENSIEGETPSLFSAEMIVGVDGKTNGPILTMLALGAAVSVNALLKEMERGGIYSTKEGKPSHYSQWYEADDSQDLYENTADVLAGSVQKAVKTPEEIKAAFEAAKKANGKAAKKLYAAAFSMFTQKHLDALLTVTGVLTNGTSVTSAGRNLVKTPITAFFFGSSLNRAVEAMEDKFIESIYAAYEGFAKDVVGGEVSEKQTNYINQLNVLINLGNSKLKKQINPKLPIDNLMQAPLDWEIEAALRKAFSKIMGKSVKGTFESKFDVLIRRRKTLNETHAANFATYSAIYERMRQQEIDRLVEAGEIASINSTNSLGDTTKKPIHDMLPSQEAAFNEKIKDVLPLVHTAMSLEEGNLDAGLFVAKDKATDSTNPLYKNKVQLKTVDEKGKATEGKREASSMHRVKEEPGVAGTAFQTHSLDASIMHNTVATVDDVLNVHDEASGSIAAVREIAQTINKNTIEYLLKYSPAREALNTLERMIIGMDQKQRRNGINDADVRDIFETWAAIFNKRFPFPEQYISAEEAGEAILNAAVANAFAADVTRLQTIAQIGNVDQYTWEGGQAEVSEEVRQSARDQLAKLKKEPSAQAAKALARLSAVFKAETKEQKAETKTTEAPAKKQSIREQVIATLESQKLRHVSWLKNHTNMGALATKQGDHHAGMLNFFANNPAPTAKELLEHLTVFGNGLMKSEIEVAKQIQRVIDPNMVIKYLTKDTQESEVLNGPEGARSSQAWYIAVPTEEGKLVHEAYILGADFAKADVRPAVVLHELLHAALSQAIAEAEVGNGSPEAKQFVSVIQALMNATATQINTIQSQNTVQARRIQGYKETALANVQEFVAYGMTDLRFQQLVLNKVMVPTGDKEHPFISGMRSFINSVVGFITGTGKRNISGTEAMVRNVAGLFEAVATQGTSESHYVSLSHASSASIHTTQAIYETLDGKGLSAPFDAKLNSLLGNLVQSIHGLYGSLGEARMAAQSMTPRDIWERAEKDGVMPFASQSLAAGFRISEKEAFVLEQVEVTIKTALDSNSSTTTVAYNELAKLYREAQRKVTPKDFHKGDWATATPSEIKAAEALHAFIFKIEKGADNRSDYLARFAALGLTHEGFNKVLQQETDIVAKAAVSDSIVTKLERWFHQLLEMLTGKLTKTYAGQHANDKLEALVTQLVGIEAKRIAKQNKPPSELLQPIGDGIQKVTDGIRLGIEKIGRSDFISKRNPIIAGTGALVSTIAGNRVELLMNNVAQVRDNLFKERHGFIAGVIDEVRGTTEHNMDSHEALRLKKHSESVAKTLATHTGNTLLSGFLEDGAKLTADHKDAITSVLLRTEVFSLLDNYKMSDIEGMLRNPKILERHIAALENRLNTFKADRNFYIQSSKLLGYLLATGEVRGEHVLMNAHNIANMFGTRREGMASLQQREAAQGIIDPLVTMYALRYSSKRDLAYVQQVLDMELPRGKDNGITMVLKAHKAMHQDSKERLFVDAETLMQKGYVPEIMDSRIDMVVANLIDGAKLEKMGYAKHGQVSPDQHDPDKTPRHIYVMHGGGQVAYQSGAFSTTGEHRAGSRAATSEVKTASEWVANRNNVGNMFQRKQQAIADMFKPNPSFDPSAVSDNYAAPVLDSKGGVMDYRYLMGEHNKDVLMNRNSSFEKVLGRLVSSTYDKETTKTQNRKLVKMLHEQYKDRALGTDNSYVYISPKSDNPELRQIFKMLPKDTQQAIRETWGVDDKAEGMWVRIDLLNTMFGYRQLSMSQIFDTDPQTRNIAEKLTIQLLNTFLGDKAQIRIQRTEAIWQELVHATKDNLVIRSFSTLKGNMISNISLLLLHGLSPIEIVKQFRVALKGATQYRKDMAELHDLQLKVAAGYAVADKAKMENRILQLEDSIARNPAYELIKEGLLPTIVEDVAPEDDMYSYKSDFAKSVEKYSNKLNKKVLSVGKTVFMAHDTKLYQMMSHATQVSDFLARYALYQNKINHQKKPLTKKQAIQLASDSFINYDLPSHRILQYMNDMGFVWFTKYYLRVQKVLANLYQAEPGRVAGMLAFEKYVMNTSTVLDSTFINRLYNPISDGAFKYPGSISEIATMKMGSGLFSGLDL